MAIVKREGLGALHEKISIQLVKDDFMPAFEKKLKEYAKKANIPGFRKGMVPSAMIRKMYGPSVFSEEVNRAISEQLETYINKEKLAIFARPMVIPANRKPLDFNKPEDVEFDFEIGIKPELDLWPVIKNTVLTRYKILVTEKMLDDEVARLGVQHGTEDEQNEVTTADNIIHGDYEPCDADGMVTEGAVKTEFRGRLDSMPSRLQEMVMGKHPADTIVFRPVDACTLDELKGFLEDTLKTNESAAEQHYRLTINKVGLLMPEKPGPDLFAKVYKDTFIKDEAEFRGKLKEELENEYKRVAEERLQNEMYEYLVHQTPMQLPVAFLKRWMMEGGEERKSADQVEKEFGSFEHQLRWQLISDTIMANAGIQVTREEVEKNIKANVLAYFGLGPDDEDEAPWLDSYMAKMEKDEKTMDETYRRLLYGKLFHFLGLEFNIEEKEIEEDAFFELGDAHAAHHHHH